MEKIKIGKINRQKSRRTNLVDKAELQAQKMACMNALLNRPWITKEHDRQLYYWIKEKQPELKQWFMEFAGYSLFVNSKLAKLDKAPVVAYPWMGFREFRESLDYVLFTYALWFLESKLEKEQFLLTALVKEVREYMSEQGMEVDWKNYFHRLSMARALKKLKALGIVQAVDGQELHWAQSETNTSDVLYESTPYSRYVLRNFPKVLNEYTTLIELRETIDYGSEQEEQNRRRKHHLYRRYLLEPVVQDRFWRDDLLYFHGQRKNILTQINSMFGWEGSRYREGLIFFESENMTEAELFPTLSSISDIILLVCSSIREEVTSSDSEMNFERDGTIHLTRGEVERILIQLQMEYKKYWINDYSKMKSSNLAEEVFNHLVEWGFGEWGEDGLFLLNAIAGRWSVKYGAVELET
ncbi:TIGR02678 family protein [Paenibacillus pasadenensis]|uniref:TIGR02678 family protein n=1 Tax=Paenibacillus pasadenensis TaxID=217090 RepID=UPI002040FED5|nr:TIGR02678 family protein [Paenibacillus pasadenensis]MCM3749259.1 TIGR02678 family protein [Paenibacillus pasadenensis]